MSRRLLSCQRGAAVVEFAVAVPVFAFMLIGLIETTRYTFFGITAAHAARAAVQYGAQNVVTAADTTGMKNAATADVGNPSAWTVTPTHLCTSSGSVITCPNGSGAMVSSLTYFVQVQVTGTFTPLIRYPGLPSSVPVTASATMRVIGQ